MHTFEDTVEALVRRAPDALEDSLRALREPPEDYWSTSPLGDLPGFAVAAAAGAVPEGYVDTYRHAHQLGLIFGWLSETAEDPAEDPRLRGYVLGRWKATLAEAAALAPARVVDRVVHTMRWMRWGLSNESMAQRSGSWTLPEYHRCLRWKAAGRGLTASLLIKRFAPAKSAVFERTFEQLVLGLAQTNVSPHSGLPRLLGCGLEDLYASGIVALEMAQIEARAAGLGGIAEFCRDYPRERGASPRSPMTSSVRSKKTAPDRPDAVRKRKHS